MNHVPMTICSAVASCRYLMRRRLAAGRLQGGVVQGSAITALVRLKLSAVDKNPLTSESMTAGVTVLIGRRAVTHGICMG